MMPFEKLKADRITMTNDFSHLPYRPCVGIMLLNAEGKVWIGQRSDADPKKRNVGTWWQMPQGGIDEGEDPGPAAMRELKEETGVSSAEIIAESKGWLTFELPPELVGKAWKGRYRGQKQKWYAMRFMGNDTEVALDQGPGKHPEFDAWRWADLTEVVSVIVPFKRSVYERVVREFGHLADMA